MNDSITKPEPTRILGIRASAIVEMLLGLVLLLVIDFVFFDGNRFWEVNPHPFWIVVLLMAALSWIPLGRALVACNGGHQGTLGRALGGERPVDPERLGQPRRLERV